MIGSLLGMLGAVWWLLVGIAALFAVVWLSGFMVIPLNRVGIVSRWWSPKGSLDRNIIALGGEAGYQPDVLRGGIHFRTPLMYRVHKMPIVTVPQGQIGYVFARDGKPLDNGQTLGRVIEGNFQSAREFLDGGGQKGPQRGIIREGSYAFNLAQFAVITQGMVYYLPMGNDTEEADIDSMKKNIERVGGFSPVVIKNSEDRCGIVTVLDGPTLQQGEIIAPLVGESDDPSKPTHNGFQDPEAFLLAGGYRGRQYQVLTEGNYFINRLFADVELIAKTTVPVGYAGVVVSYYGPKGEDLSGEEYKHGELVAKGHKGVWNESLMPGKYAFNTYAGTIVMVPTTNIILKWIASETGEHSYDENLAEIGLITKDAFEPLLPLSVVVHIDYKKAPLVVQRFGDVKLLVEQTLDPMVASYFKNQGQRKTLIELIQERAEIQASSSTDMKERFARYNLELEEVLIGTPHAALGADGTKSDAAMSIEAILKQLRDRQVAVEQKETYRHEREAAIEQKSLEEAQAVAAKQKELTDSLINIGIMSNAGEAAAKKATQEAEVIRVTAAAEADKTRLMADADAERITKIGIANAVAIDEQARAYGGPGNLLTQDVMTKVAAAIEGGGMDIVPKTVITTGGSDGGDVSQNSAFSLFMTLLSAEQAKSMSSEPAEQSDAVKKAAEAVRSSMSESKTVKPASGDKAPKKPAKSAAPAEASVTKGTPAE